MCSNTKKIFICEIVIFWIIIMEVELSTRKVSPVTSFVCS